MGEVALIWLNRCRSWSELGELRLSKHVGILEMALVQLCETGSRHIGTELIRSSQSCLCSRLKHCGALTTNTFLAATVVTSAIDRLDAHVVESVFLRMVTLKGCRHDVTLR